MRYQITDKYYSKKDNLFHVIKRRNDSSIEHTFDTFKKFYNAVGKDLKDANLLNYDFEGIELNKYDLSKAKISSSIMIKAGIYKKKLYNAITKTPELSNIPPTNFIKPSSLSEKECEEVEYSDFVLCYISDLHLDNKLIKKFPTAVNKYELHDYFLEVIGKLYTSFWNIRENLYGRDPSYSIVFVGDTTYSFEVFKIFFKTFREYFPNQRTFVILGNHELCDLELTKKCKSIEEIIKKYRDFLTHYRIRLLENDLYIPSENRIYSEDEILNNDAAYFRKKFLVNGYAIFGGIGFAGLNMTFNCEQKIYGNLSITREEEKERSKKINAIHQKLTRIASDKKIFFITHMPKEDWSADDYNKNWVYMSGHTHKNYFVVDETKKIYADNQIGNRNSYGFKYTACSQSYNIFQDYPDGIYELSREQYKAFYRAIGIYIDLNRFFKKLYMVKKDEAYCFLSETFRNDKLKLLNGGRMKNIGSHDLHYIYENLGNYSRSVKLAIESYDDFQKQLSREVKRIGGDGKIHGCIVDIDFFDHLYVNPIDSTITAYSASSITHKYVYANLISLLKANNRQLYNRYRRLLQNPTRNKNLMILNKNLIESDERIFVSDTEIYKISRVVKSFQYIRKYNIVRLWNDDIISTCSAENGSLVLSRLLNSDEE